MFNCTGKPSPQGVLLILAEDDLGSVIVPRLKALGANLNFVRVYDPWAIGDQSLRLPDDMELIEKEAGEVNAKLIVIDPITAFLSGNAYSDQSVRKTLGPLTSFADRTGASVVLLRHLTKANVGNVLYRGGGSIGFSAAARSGLLVAPAPGNPEQRILAQYKSNHGSFARSLCFKIIERDGTSQIEWIGESRFKADELITSSSGEDRSILQEAIFVIFSLLAEGRMAAKDVRTEALDAGVSSATLKRAKKALKVKSVREGFGKSSRFFWELPDQDELVEQLQANEMESLIERLLDDSDDDDSADWWKGGSGPGDDDDGGSPVVNVPGTKPH